MKEIEIIESGVKSDYITRLKEFINNPSYTIIGEAQTHAIPTPIGSIRYIAIIFYTKN